MKAYVWALLLTALHIACACTLPCLRPLLSLSGPVPELLVFPERRYHNLFTLLHIHHPALLSKSQLTGPKSEIGQELYIFIK